MKVYVTFQNSEEIIRIFSTETAAQDDVIIWLKSFLSRQDLLQHEWEEMALEYIEEHEVIEP